MNPYKPRDTPEYALADDPEAEALARIAIVSQNAKAAWFGLLAALVFTVVTLMGHEDADFFAFGAATTLPVINLEVPPESFFLAAPILITALYVYLHLYLLNLWEVLSDAPPQIKGAPLAKKAYPAMINSAAIWYRNRRCGDGSFPPRPMGSLMAFVNTLLVWGFAWGVLVAMWWRSMPAHDPLTTWIVALCLTICVAVGTVGGVSARGQLRNQRTHDRRTRGWHGAANFILLLTALTSASLMRTAGQSPFNDDWLARADLAEKELTIKPADWLDYEQWVQDYEHTYKIRNGLRIGEALTGDHLTAFREDMKIRRKALTDALQNKTLRGRDLRNADLADTFLAGADLREARMEGADLSEANLKSTDLRGWSIAPQIRGFYGS
ncbi:MAG: pentapeptide repeat-containing protein [Pseudomonadota bacterium]